MPKVIELSLAPGSLERAEQEVKKYAMELDEKVEALIRKLAERGAMVAKIQLAALDAVYTGELLSSIEGIYSEKDHVGIVRAGAPYAIFVEYGTGVIGAGSPHPKADGWQYDANGHGDKGWVYLNNRDGKYHWTRGYQSRPFMYNTARELERECVNIAKEVFGLD